MNRCIKISRRIITASIGAVFVLYSCKNLSVERYKQDTAQYVAVASGKTYDFEAFYTLKGEIAMQMFSSEMLEYTDPEFPRQIFPKGLHMEIINSKGEKTTVDARKAVVYKKTGLVELIDKVIIVGPDGSSLMTDRLFWDRAHEHLFTDEPIEFKRKDEFIKGIGFDSNMHFTNARVQNVVGVINLKTKQ